METVKIIECPRDAWQGLKVQIPAAQKAAYLQALIDAGFRHLDAVSFVSPKAVPQMADSEEVLQQLRLTNDVEIIGIVVNEKGAERAIATGKVGTLGYPTSLSATFLRRNQNQSLEENRATLTRIKAQADTAGLKMVAYISMGFGNPYDEPWSEKEVADAAAALIGQGIQAVSIADTIGAADAAIISRVVTAVRRECPKAEIGVHLHSTRAETNPKILAAYDAGCRRFDAALGGLGGCPFAQNQLVGNVPTEEVVRALHERGVMLPIESKMAGVVALSDKIASGS